METQSPKFKARLGLFVATGIALFVIAIFYIGRQQHLFNPVFKISSKFNNVSGLQVGNNIRFSGINVGTVDDIFIINDSTVKVDMLVDVDVKKFIKTDCRVAIGSEGIIGDRVINITQGNGESPTVKDGQMLQSMEPVETDAIISSLQVTAENAEVVSGELAEIMFNINQGKGTLGRLIHDTTIAENIDQTIENLKSGSKSLDQNMEAAKSNFLLKGYFKKKERARKEAEERRLKELEKNEKK
jgi:phospholipid/cholesterol/gamma-HCH transport system substrate-binding protein